MNFRRYYAVEKWVTGRHKKGKKLKEQTRRRNKWLLRQRLGKYLDKHPEVDMILREMVPFTSNAEIKWFYAEDDELAMGILEALNGGGMRHQRFYKRSYLCHKTRYNRMRRPE